MHQVKTDDMFKLLGSTWKVRSVYSGYFCASADSHGGITLDLDKADLLEWEEPEKEPEHSRAMNHLIEVQNQREQKLKREILEEIAEAWRDADDKRYDAGETFYYQLLKKAKSL